MKEASAIFETLDVLEASVPNVAAAQMTAGIVENWSEAEIRSADHFDEVHPKLKTILDSARRILKRSACSSEGLSVILEASRADPERRLPPGWPFLPVRNVLLNVVREAKPTTDATAKALLNAADDDDPEVRGASR